MNALPLTSIIVLPNRQRREFDPQALQELKVSIEYDPEKENCQLQNPPVLRQPSVLDRQDWPDIDFDKKQILVSGERRLRAIQEIFELGGKFLYGGETFTAELGLIPYTDFGLLSPLEAEEAELDENLRRRDLTWQEHAAAVGRLHALRQAQTDAIRIMHQTEETRPASHTIADTALEITGRSDGSFQNNIRKEILISKHLSNPAVAKAKSTDEAFKILKRQEEQQRNIEQAAVIGASFTADAHRVLHMNCLEFMADPANAGVFDVICTDPPYGMGADNFGDAGGKMTGIEHHYDDSYEAWQKLLSAWCPLSYAVTKPQAHAYVFCDFDRFHELKAMMQSAGWYVFRTPLVVHKLNSGRVPLPDQGPRRQYELVLYAIKGKKPVTHIYGDVITCNADDNMSHGAQKPVALYQNLLQRSVHAGDKILDSFAGTAGTIPAAHTYKCAVTAIEDSAESYAMACKRLQDLMQSETQLEIEGL